MSEIIVSPGIKKLTFFEIGQMHYKDLASGIEEAFDPSALIGVNPSQNYSLNKADDILERLYK